jgi:hypothetical protein
MHTHDNNAPGRIDRLADVAAAFAAGDDDDGREMAAALARRAVESKHAQTVAAAERWALRTGRLLTPEHRAEVLEDGFRGLTEAERQAVLALAAALAEEVRQ